LIARYEELRCHALARFGPPVQGLVLFMRRGMRAWMQAWSQCMARPLPSPATPSDDLPTCPVRLHAAVAMLLADMILFARQEAIA